MSQKQEPSTAEKLMFDVAPLDAYAERITSGVAMLGGVLLLPALFLYLSGIGFRGAFLPGVLVTIAIALALMVWLALNYAVQPTYYQINDDALLVQRRWARALRVPFKEITGASAAGGLADIHKRGRRRSFNAGVYGYQGPFQLAPYGAAFFVATHRERLVAVARTNDPPLILSPAHPRDFVAALREALAGQLSRQDDKMTR